MVVTASSGTLCGKGYRKPSFPGSEGPDRLILEIPNLHDVLWRRPRDLSKIQYFPSNYRLQIIIVYFYSKLLCCWTSPPSWSLYSAMMALEGPGLVPRSATGVLEWQWQAEGQGGQTLPRPAQTRAVPCCTAGLWER